MGKDISKSLVRCTCGEVIAKRLGKGRFQIQRIVKGKAVFQNFEHDGDIGSITCHTCGRTSKFPEVLRTISTGMRITVTATEDMKFGIA